ncbi:MAG: chemoreceptor glutamine deamidase CheD [Pseudomonadaceae bacterium]|jgi:chemotaxis protein CheD|uniref:chemoreceptor glutamine deamidase CheD n=1 Tax=Pseudomonas sp. TaxID=306 RepID=UPI002C5A73F3|nr:chemoreceptor glutamine deamidase CheD [Pseudomonas sp.]MBX9714441.1 chemoreceptor glutamine deamidase CheD [Pseudomonadaceae bacterium]HRL92875.1 chemoreceptor glutamine deamidase CheD [Pseudomonas sp.]
MEYDFISSLAPNTYFDRHFNCEAVKILPGEYFVTQRDLVIVTVLGSCVSVCLRDHVSGIGGMNHFMLPGNNDGGISPISASARYGVYAMELLINHLLKLGARRNCFEAKVFGGGSVLRGMTANNIGDRNVEFVRDYLHTEHIPVVAEDLLDIYPRKVYYFPATGRVMVKKLRNLHNTTLLDREMEYSLRIKRTPVVGEIDLF